MKYGNEIADYVGRVLESPSYKMFQLMSNDQLDACRLGCIYLLAEIYKAGGERSKQLEDQFHDYPIPVVHFVHEFELTAVEFNFLMLPAKELQSLAHRFRWLQNRGDAHLKDYNFAMEDTIHDFLKVAPPLDCDCSSCLCDWVIEANVRYREVIKGDKKTDLRKLTKPSHN